MKMTSTEHILFHQIYHGKWIVKMENNEPVALIDFKTKAEVQTDIPVYKRLLSAGYIDQEHFFDSNQAWPECTLKGYRDMFACLNDAAWKNACTVNPKLTHKLDFYSNEFQRQNNFANNPDTMKGFLQGIQLAHTLALQNLQREMEYWYGEQSAKTSTSPYP